jgi:phospholipid/cholesterol/gamma-HCH transport system permease protein
VHRFEVVGVSALGIIGLMSFLIGIVIAQQGAVQLRQFGAEVYTINLVGRITLRELGILMTAIMVAGRSGSAFAAQIGTMKLTEEIDAMRTIGVSPMEALVVPRTLAVVLMLPLLGFYSALIGDHRRRAALLDPARHPADHLRPAHPRSRAAHRSLGRAGQGAGVRRDHRHRWLLPGHAGRGDAEQVGRRTTIAVVQAIFLVIVLDAFFAVFFTQVGWI